MTWMKHHARLCYKIAHLLAHQLLVQGFLRAVTARSGICMVVSDSRRHLGGLVLRTRTPKQL